MNRRRVFDHDHHAHFLTFSCFRRRRLLDDDQTRRAVLEVLAILLHRRDAKCVGYVVMPNHVHAIVWLPGEGQLVDFIKQWKRTSSVKIKRILSGRLVAYAGTIDPDDAVWQASYYDFNIYSEHMMKQKLDYMHMNPVRAGLATEPGGWPWSSARYYEFGSAVDVPVGWLD